MAVAGQNCNTSFAQGALFQPGQKNVVYMQCGTNNIAGGQTAAQTYTALTSYITSAHAAGFTIIVATMFSRENPTGLEASRVAYNALIRANTAGADAVVDFDSTALGCNGCANNTIYFNSDKIHPNNTGEINVEVPLFQAVLP